MNGLTVSNLAVSFDTPVGRIQAVRDVSFNIAPKTTCAIVGESGCGKSVTSLAIMRLVPSPGHIDCGEVHLDATNLSTLPEKEMRRIRGGTIGMIFQDPMTSLNPVYTCGNQIDEAVLLHRNVSKKEAREITSAMLLKVGISDTQRILAAYPHELSGGMKQRIMIAMALCCHPAYLIADEPTTALDVTVQARILDLLKELQQDLGMGLILITHNLGIVSDIAHELMIMYAGWVVEKGPVASCFEEPLHPYTRALLDTVPRLHRDQKRLTVIPGEVPDPANVPRGCPFHPRCSKAFDRCKQEEPGITTPSSGRQVRCFLYD